MKFMVSWQAHDDRRHEVLKSFAGMSDADAAAEFGNLKVIGRWHDMVGFTGVAIVETDDPSALTLWLLKWNDAIDIQTVPVFDDDEARKVGRKALG
jgi:Domain of unknown function (DUF3303)